MRQCSHWYRGTVILRAEVRVQLLDALASEEASVQRYRRAAARKASEASRQLAPVITATSSSAV